MAVPKDPRTLELAEPFVGLFPIEPDTLKLVTDSIREQGFKRDEEILTWKDAFGEQGRTVVVDGHTRLRAALALKLAEVPTTVRRYKSLDEALTEAIGRQVKRRNMNREQLAAYVISVLPLLDETRGGLRTRTAKQLAAMLGVSEPTVARARGVLNSGDEELIAKVKDGGISILAAYDQVTGRVAPPPAHVPPRHEDHVRMAAELLEDPEVAAGVLASPSPGRSRVESAVHEKDREGRQKTRERAKQVRDIVERSRFLDVSYKVTEASREINKVTMYLQSVETKDLMLDRYDVEDVGQLREDMAYLQEWMDRCVAAVEARLGENGLRKTIAAIRAKTVERGATPEEAALAQEVADRLEKRLVKKLTGASAA